MPDGSWDIPANTEDTINYLQLESEIPDNANQLRVSGTVRFYGDSFPFNVYQQLCISTSVEGENSREIANAGSTGPGDYNNTFEYTLDGFDDLKATQLYLIHGIYGETYNIEIEDLQITYRYPNPMDIISVQDNLDEIKADVDIIEERFSEYTDTMNLDNQLIFKADKYPFVLQQVAKGGPMLNLIIDTQKIVNQQPQEPWHIIGDNGYRLDVSWSYGAPTLIYTRPRPDQDPEQLTIMMYGYTLYPNYMIPDVWSADTITGGVPDELFTVLYNLKEIIELIGQWKDLNREATSIVDAINKSVIANDYI
jgi:hypothetical protein